MSCFYPLWRQITFSGELVKVPCGRCRGCRMDRAKMWALRCIHESEMHEENCFVSLTYDPEHLPKDGSINKREVQLFLKRLRRAIEPRRVRYYACGEYGERMGRPHYHALLFGIDFPDKKLFFVETVKRNRFGCGRRYEVYTSEMLAKIWQMGHCTIGEVNLETCGYTARYIGKKIGGAMAREHYKGKTPEFALMSNDPGIGASWFDKYWKDVYPKDFYTVNGRRYKAPQYYDRRLMRRDWYLYEQVKEARKERIENPDIIRRRQKEKYLANVTKTLERSLEYE